MKEVQQLLCVMRAHASGPKVISMVTVVVVVVFISMITNQKARSKFADDDVLQTRRRGVDGAADARSGVM